MIIAFYLLFFFILANLYIYCLLFCLFCVVLYFVCVSFQKGFSILFNYTYFYFFEAIEIFVVLLNVLNIYLTSLFFQITNYTLLSEKKESKITGNKFSLLLLLLNLNNVRFLTFIDHYTQELKKIPGFHSLSLSNKRINSSGSLIFSSSDGLLNALLSNLYNSPRSLSTSKVEASFILELLN